MAHAQRADINDQQPNSRPRRGKPHIKGLEKQPHPTTPEPEAATALVVDFSEQAHIGKRKKEQQDAHGHFHLEANPATHRPACYLFVVADGVSMGQAGALASRTAVDELLKYFKLQLEAGQTDLAEVFSNAFSAANNEVFQLARTRPGMATTCVAVLLVGNTLVTAHAGDSRAYLARAGRNPKAITLDHSWVTEMGEQMVQQGKMTAEELLKDRRRHTITDAFGLTAAITPEINTAEIEPDDLIIVCTDGLWDMLPRGQFEQHLDNQGHTALAELSQKVVDQAMEAGGRDNITLTLIRVGSTGQPYPMPALPEMVQHTAERVARRVRPLELAQPAGPPEAVSPAPAPPETATIPPPALVDDPDLIEDVPSMKLPVYNLEMMLAKAQRSFSLGDWDQSIEQFIELELLQASYHGLYESFASVLIRYTGINLGEGKIEQCRNLLNQLESHHILRYHELLADYCNDESRRAAGSQHFVAALAYAQFCLRLRPGDMRARSLSELSELYLLLQKPHAALPERLALAQKIYARDDSFGAIQDDLARIYMELGDEAVKKQVWEDAVGWYSMIGPLRPGETRLVSLASNKLRSVQDDLNRRAARRSEEADSGSMAVPISTLPNTGSAAALRALERERAINDGRPEVELLNRLKERVSRTQKAWDSGRKEVGAEYIYLVEQLNDLLMPNPWQTTFPRVCYDYGKWLLDQKQLDEARPFFQRAHQLGMAAAQQRLNEIDREVRNRAPVSRNPVALDLPEIRPEVALTLPEPPVRLPSRPPLFPVRRPSTPPGPIVPPKPEVPAGANFVGATRSPETALIKPVEPLPVESRPPNPPPALPPRSAAVIAAGNWERPAPDEPVIPAQTNPDDTAAGDRQRPASAVSGTLRHKANGLWNTSIYQAANREASRVAGTGLPQSLNPRNARLHRWVAFFGLVKSVLLPGMVVGVVALAILLVVLVIVPNIKPAPGPADLPLNSATAPGATGAAAQPTATSLPLQGVQGIVRLAGAKPEEVQVFLATAGDPNSPYREFVQESGYFRLPATTLNRLDPRQKYIVVVKPRDSAERKYAENLAPSNPAQQPFISPELVFDPVKGFDTTLRIVPEALAFYPLQGGDKDQDQPTGRYFGATRHSLRGEYLKFYQSNGGLARFGFPLSEEFEWSGNGQVQFFERGWLAIEANGKPVTVGRVGKALLDSTCSTIPRVPPVLTPIAIPTLKPDPDFAAAVNTFKLGAPQSPAFEGPNKAKLQYFELGRLELNNPADKKATPALGLLGAEYARCIGWLK